MVLIISPLPLSALSFHCHPPFVRLFFFFLFFLWLAVCCIPLSVPQSLSSLFFIFILFSSPKLGAATGCGLVDFLGLLFSFWCSQHQQHQFLHLPARIQLPSTPVKATNFNLNDSNCHSPVMMTPSALPPRRRRRPRIVPLMGRHYELLMNCLSQFPVFSSIILSTLHLSVCHVWLCSQTIAMRSWKRAS